MPRTQMSKLIRRLVALISIFMLLSATGLHSALATEADTTTTAATTEVSETTATESSSAEEPAEPVEIEPRSSYSTILDLAVRKNGTVYAGSTNNGVGNHNVLLEDMRSFIELSDIGSLYAYAAEKKLVIESITLRLYSRGTSSSDTVVTAYLYTGAPWDYSTSSFTSARYNALGDKLCSVTVPKSTAKWIDFDITEIASYGTGGIVLVNQQEGVGTSGKYQSFASTKDPTYKPQLVVKLVDGLTASLSGAIEATLDTEYTTSISTAGKRTFFSFTPAETGLYTISSLDNGSSNPYAMLYNSKGELISVKNDSAADVNFRLTYHLEAGQKYYLAVGCYGSGVGTFSFKISSATDSTDVCAMPIFAGEAKSLDTAHAKKLQYLLFTPTKTDSYVISGTGSAGKPCAWVYDASGTLVSSGASTSGFNMTCRLTAGRKYYIAIECRDSAAGSFSVSVQVAPPLQPTGLSVSSITDRSVKLSWTVAANHRADRWLIEQRVNGGEWTRVGVATTKSYTVSGLTPYTKHEFRVFSETGSPAWSGVRSAASNTAAATTLPAAPAGLVASAVTESQVTLSWSSADSNVTKWIIEYSTNGTSWSSAGSTDASAKAFTVTGLSYAETYYFRVYSYSKSTGAYGAKATITQRTAPLRPTSLRATAVTTTSISLSWTTTSLKGVDRWLIQYRINGGVWKDLGSSTKESYTAKGLSPSTEYEFRALCETGRTSWQGIRSAESNTVAVTTPVARPTSLIISGITASTATLSWSGEADPTSEWIIEYSTDGTSWIYAGATQNSEKVFTVKGLTPVKTYQFRVYGYNRGIVAYSTSANIAGKTLPAQPENLSAATVSASSIKITWSVSQIKGIDRWIVHYKEASSSKWNSVSTTSRSFTLKNLAPGTKYDFKVYSENGASGSTKLLSEASVTLSTITLPVKATGLTVTDYNDTTVSLKWSSAEPNGTDRWRIRYKVEGGEWITAGTTTKKSFIVKGLSSSTRYTFRVIAEADGPNGEKARAAGVNITRSTRPGQPSDLVISDVTSSSVKLTWRVTEMEGVDRWRIYYKASGSSKWSIVSTTSTKFLLGNLTPGTKYDFKVYSEKGGSGEEKSLSKASKTIKLTTIPLKIESLSVSSFTDTTVTLKWDSAAGGGIDRWRIRYKNDDGVWVTAGTTTGKSFTVKGLSPAKKYTFKVYSEADGHNGERVRSEAYRISKTTRPIQPTSLSLSSKTYKSVTLTWDAGAGPEGGIWLVQYKASGGSWTDGVTATEGFAIVKGLSPSTKYYFRVYKLLELGESKRLKSNPSNYIKVTTDSADANVIMLDNILEADKSVIPDDKKEACYEAAKALLELEYEPAFIAGLLGNICHEGSPGLFEYYNTKQRYHINLNKYLQLKYDTTYQEAFHGKYIYEMSLDFVYKVFTDLKKMNWKVTDKTQKEWGINPLVGNDIGTGVGSVGWTFDRAYDLVKMYRKVCGNRSTITKNEAIRAEVQLIVKELRSDYYASIYTTWLSSNSAKLRSASAAADACYRICGRYERPYFTSQDKNDDGIIDDFRKHEHYVWRHDSTVAIYNVMIP